MMREKTATADIAGLAVDTIRTLAMDAVQQANSGHPGTPMALAPVIYTLWQEFLQFDPRDAGWPNRDRFVLSAGHASMLLYAMLHLARVHGGGRPPVRLQDIRDFRQLGSPCAGHPEYGHAAGIETTTGPLGQGCATSVGMAIAGAALASRFNRPQFRIFDYNVYALCSDGDMMEGISSEAASLAGHLRLGNLCWIYDDNHISIEGNTNLAFSEDVAARFRAYGWHVAHVADANDRAQLAAQLQQCRARDDAPTLIIVRSHIGYGAPHKQDTAAAHGEPLGEEEVRLAKRNYGWPEDAQFLVPEGVYAHFQDGIGRRGHNLRSAWLKLVEQYAAAWPGPAAELRQFLSGDPPEGWDRDLPVFDADARGIASRVASGQVLNAIAARHPWLIGGAADLAPSTKTDLTFEDAGQFSPADHGGRNLHFGIREHAMQAAINGMALSGWRAYASTFLIFSDYLRPALRLSALMQLPTITIFTHDSIGLGEDGPTHQPIGELLSLRGIPGLITLRPADANEVVAAWRVILPLKDQPVALVLSRQALPTFDRTLVASADGLARGAYVLADGEGGTADVILIGTGSEVALCLQARRVLAGDGIRARVVSMPSWELFEQQDDRYRDRVLPPEITARVSVEAASVIGWDRYVGRDGDRIGMHGFGASAPLVDVMAKFGFTVENVVTRAKAQWARVKEGHR